MVFFTCNSCGESLKKNKVDKHLSQCHSKSVSCVDCGKDFTYDYNSHNSCVSEDQKYGGLDYKPKENSTKGKTKQEEWVQRVKKAIDDSNCNNHIKGLLKRLSSYDNIPRKKQKFENFVRSCLKVHNEYYVQQMWQFFEGVLKSGSDQTNCQQNGSNGNKRPLNDSDSETQNKKNKSNENDIQTQEDIEDNENQTEDQTEDVVQKKNKKKSKSNGYSKSDDITAKEAESEPEEDLEPETNSKPKPKLKMKKMIVEVLINSQNNELSVKKLKKKIIKKFKSIDENVDKEVIVNKFLAKLNKIKEIEINDELVSLRIIK